MKFNIKNIFFPVLIAVSVISCESLKNVTKTYEKPEVPKDFSENLYGQNTSKDSLSSAKISWKEIYSDPKLQQIITRVLQNNLDLKVAVERINEADAVFKQSQLAHLPTLNGNIGAGISKNSGALQNSGNSSTSSNFQLGVTSGWEIDIWGKIAAAKRSAYANLLETDAAKRAIQTQLVTQTANYYYQLLAYDKQLEITKQTIEIRRKDVETVKALMQAAFLTGADIAQSEANLYSAQVSIPDIQLNIRETENAISFLMGETPQEIDRSALESQNIYRNLQTGVPMQLLKYRPDVQQAEFAFRQAFENKNIALADLYPSLNLTAALGLSTRNFADFFNNSLFYSLGANLAQPIFQHGTKRANIKIAEARKQQALYNFQNTLLNAGSEVSTSLFSYEQALEKEKTRNLQISSLERAVSFNNELLTYSSKVNYINVLTAEQSLLQAKLSAINDKLQQLLAVSNFYRSVGGYQSGN